MGYHLSDDDRRRNPWFHVALLLSLLLGGSLMWIYLQPASPSAVQQMPPLLPRTTLEPSTSKPTPKPPAVSHPPSTRTLAVEPPKEEVDPVEMLNNPMERRIVDMRLPTDIRPVTYDLKIKFFLPDYGTRVGVHANEFHGEVDIKFTVDKPTKWLVLNQKELTHTDLGIVQLEDGTFAHAVDWKVDTIYDKVILKFRQPLPLGTHSMMVKYRGRLYAKRESEALGVYLSEYATKEGKQSAVVTQFEPDYARTMVPCFDEPSFKATWDVTITHPKETVALGNQMEKSQTMEGDWKVTSYETTPIMPSYLLALAVVNYSYVEAKSESGVRLRVYTPEVEIGNAEFALEAAVKCLDFMEKHFGIPLPLKKTDLISVDYYWAGAMENYGLITFRPSELQYNHKYDNLERKLRVARVVAHELEHMWFGNLVTMRYWDSIWLNEGFAAYTEALGLDAIFDGIFEAEKDVVNQGFQETMRREANGGRLPIMHKINVHSDIIGSFSNVYYQGSTLLYMVRGLMGRKRFEDGLRKYLMKFAYGNVGYRDLFEVLNSVLPADQLGADGRKLDLVSWARPWLEQSGYPTVTLTPLNGTHAEITQRRSDSNSDKTTWDVPLWIQKGSRPMEFYWLPKNRSLVIPYDGREAVVVNADSSSMTKVKYHEDGWRRIAQQLKANHSVYTEQTRNRLITNSVGQSHGGNLSWDVTLELIEYVAKEEHFVPHVALFNAFLGFDKSELYKRLFANSADIDLAAMIDSYSYGANFARYRTKILRFLALCKIAPEECDNQLAKVFELKHKSVCGGMPVSSECSAVPIDMRPEVYCAAVRLGGNDTYWQFREFIEHETHRGEKGRLSDALGCKRSREPEFKSGSFASDPAAKTDLHLEELVARFHSTGHGGAKEEKVSLEERSAVWEQSRAPLAAALKKKWGNASF